MNKYAVNSFLQYFPKLVEPFITTARTAAAPSNNSVVTYQLNAFHHKLTMMEGKHEQGIVLDLHDFDMQHKSWNIADNLALEMLLFSVFWI